MLVVVEAVVHARGSYVCRTHLFNESGLSEAWVFSEPPSEQTNSVSRIDEILALVDELKASCQPYHDEVRGVEYIKMENDDDLSPLAVPIESGSPVSGLLDGCCVGCRQNRKEFEPSSTSAMSRKSQNQPTIRAL